MFLLWIWKLRCKWVSCDPRIPFWHVVLVGLHTNGKHINSTCCKREKSHQVNKRNLTWLTHLKMKMTKQCRARMQFLMPWSSALFFQTWNDGSNVKSFLFIYFFLHKVTFLLKIIRHFFDKFFVTLEVENFCWCCLQGICLFEKATGPIWFRQWNF